MHPVILKLFHFYLFNFSYKSNMVVLHHSHITAVFVNMALSDKLRFWQSHWLVYGLTMSMCRGKSMSFRAPAVANQIFSVSYDIQAVLFRTIQSLQKKTCTCWIGSKN